MAVFGVYQFWRSTAFILAMIAASTAAMAQDAPRTAPTPSLEDQVITNAPPAPRPVPAPTPQDRRRAYESEARELAQVIGASHYLRWLCYGRRDQQWRFMMERFLDTEDQRLRAPLALAFNEGFDQERLRFDRCTPAAQAREAEWKTKGMRLADTLSARNKD